MCCTGWSPSNIAYVASEGGPHAWLSVNRRGAGCLVARGSRLTAPANLTVPLPVRLLVVGARDQAAAPGWIVEAPALTRLVNWGVPLYVRWDAPVTSAAIVRSTWTLPRLAPDKLMSR
jgi:hypothetical protein